MTDYRGRVVQWLVPRSVAGRPAVINLPEAPAVRRRCLSRPSACKYRNPCSVRSNRLRRRLSAPCRCVLCTMEVKIAYFDVSISLIVQLSFRGCISLKWCEIGTSVGLAVTLSRDR